ncbi:MAG: diphthine--ammonia ligase [Candidatus Parvarchaeota archaeon]|nr:diphthine--ammonia ligase [Candidatus Parvarchaeota archaeon]
MDLAVLFTGGKDSTYSMFLASKENSIKCLLNVVSDSVDSYMFHTVGSNLVELQAKALEIPLIRTYTKAVKEEELEDLKFLMMKAKQDYGVDGVCTGAIESRYQSDRVRRIAEQLDLKVINPLWHIDVAKYMRDLVHDGFKAMIISVSADGLSKELLGRIIDGPLLEELDRLSRKYRFNLAFEGGEAETAVVDAPIFKSRISVDEYTVKSDGSKSFMLIKEAHLVAK